MTVVIRLRTEESPAVGAVSMYRALREGGMRESSAARELARYLAYHINASVEPSMLTAEGTRTRLDNVINAMISVRDRLGDA